MKGPRPRHRELCLLRVAGKRWGCHRRLGPANQTDRRSALEGDCPPVEKLEPPRTQPEWARKMKRPWQPKQPEPPMIGLARRCSATGSPGYWPRTVPTSTHYRTRASVEGGSLVGCRLGAAPLRVGNGDPAQDDHNHQRTNARQNDFHGATPTNSGMYLEKTQESIPRADKRAVSYQKIAAEGRAIAVEMVGSGVGGRVAAPRSHGNQPVGPSKTGMFSPSLGMRWVADLRGNWHKAVGTSAAKGCWQRWRPYWAKAEPSAMLMGRPSLETMRPS